VESIKKFLDMITKPNFFETMAPSVDELLNCIKLLCSLEKSPGLLKKDQAILSTLCKTFEEQRFKELFYVWKAKTEELESLKSDTNYSKKLENLKSASSDYVKIQKKFDKIVQEYDNFIGKYHAAVHSFNILRYKVAQCCLTELHKRVELYIPVKNRD